MQHPPDGAHPAAPTSRPRTRAPSWRGLAVLLCIGGLGAGPALAAPVLGSAQAFAVLAHETVTNAHVPPADPTQVFGDVGVTPGSSITGFAPSGIVTGGSVRIDDPVSQQALLDAGVAYGLLSGQASDVNLTGQDLGSFAGALTPGVYTYANSAALTGTLVLDFGSDPGGSFVFQIGSSLTTASDALVTVLGAGPQSAVYWQVGSSATFGLGTDFAGNVLALSSITLDPGARILGGRAIALGGAVTMIDNLVTGDCSAGALGSGCLDGGSLGYSGGLVSAVPEPASAALMVSGLALVALRRRRGQARTGQPACVPAPS